MSEPTFHHLSGGLAEEAAFVRRLARSLVRDEHEAEDIAQDAAVAALSLPHRPRTSTVAWLSGTVRNLVRMRARSGARRRAREYAAAKAEGVPSAAEQAARAEMLRRLASAVAALPDPARSTLLLRYYDDLPPREIARRTGEAIDTVKSRLKRSLAELRRVLDERCGGGRREWTALLLPVGVSMEGIGSVASAAGAVLMSAKMKVVAAASVLALVLGATFSVLSSNPPEAGPEEPLSVSALRDGGGAERDEAATTAAATTMTLVGLVLGPDDAPLEGVAVGIPRSGGVAWVQSDAAGRFRIEGISGGPTVAIRAVKLGYRFEGPRSIPTVAGDAPLTIRMIADRFIRVRGRVVGEEDVPLVGAVVGARISGSSEQIDDLRTWLSLRHLREELFSRDHCRRHVRDAAALPPLALQGRGSCPRARPRTESAGDLHFG